MADNNAVKSRRDTQIERLRGQHPDKKFDDDEEIFGQIFDDYDEYEKRLGEYRDREKTLSDMFAADPRSAEFLADWHNGKDPIAAILARYGSEYKDMLDDPEFVQKLADEHKAEIERIARSKQLDEDYEANMEQTLETLRQFQADNGMSDEQIDEVVNALLGIVRDGVMGKFAPETLQMMMNAINHDADVANASEEGNIAGRNAKITEQLRKSNKGDGVAHLNGKNSTNAAPRDGKPMSVFDLAKEAR